MAPHQRRFTRFDDKILSMYARGMTTREIYTTNAVESLNMSLPKALKPRVAFPSEEAALKVMCLALRNLIRKWDRSIHWKEALNCLTLLSEDRIRVARGV